MRLVDRIARFRMLLIPVFAAMFFGTIMATLVLANQGRVWQAAALMGALAIVVNGGLWLVQRREAPLQRRLRESDFGLCPGCGYPTAGRPEPICPECGDSTPQEQIRKAWEKRLGSFWPAVFDERR